MTIEPANPPTKREALAFVAARLSQWTEIKALSPQFELDLARMWIRYAEVAPDVWKDESADKPAPVAPEPRMGFGDRP